MSKRFLRWIDVWIDDNVRSGSGGDVESFAARAARLSDQLLEQAVNEGFPADEIEEESEKVAALIEKKLSTKPEFDISQFGVAGDD